MLLDRRTWSPCYRKSQIYATRYKAYRQAVDTFLAWCEKQGLALAQVSPMLVSAYIRELSGSIPKKKLHLSALRHFFDQLVVRHAVAFNPAWTSGGILTETNGFELQSRCVSAGFCANAL